MHPVLLDLGFWEIRWYGVMYAVALIVAIRGILRDLKAKKIKFNEDDILNVIMATFLGGIFFARIYYVLFNLPFYMSNPGEILAVWHGGLAIHGGIVGGFICGLWACRAYGIEPWSFADISAPYVLLGQVFGRFGNFMNGDAHGLPTTAPWGIVFPAGTPAGDQFPGIPLHPTMLYELLINLFFFVILYNLQQRMQYKRGFILALYLIFYAISRFIVSFFRADDLYLFGLNAPHLVSVLMLVGCTFAIARYQLWKKS